MWLALRLLFIVLPSAAWAQPADEPGFDPRPVEIPTIQKTAPRPVTSMDLLLLRDFHGSQISPDGKWVAFVLGQAVYESDSYRSGLFIVSTERGSKPICLGTAGAPHWDDINQWWSEDPQWSPDSKYVYYRMKDARAWQVWRWNREGGTPIQVTHFERNVQNFQVNPDGSLALTVEKPSSIDKKQIAEHGILYDGSLEAGNPRPLPDMIAEQSVTETETWAHDLSGRDRIATEAEAEVDTSWDYVPRGKLFTKKEIADLTIIRAKISPDGKKVVYQRTLLDPSDSARVSYPLYTRLVAGRESAALTPDPNYYIEEFWWSADSKEVYYTGYDSAGVDDLRPSKLMAVAATGGKARTVLDSAGYQYKYSVDRAGRFLACTHENNTTPTELRLVDLSSGDVRTLANVNPEFQNLWLSPAKRIDVTNKYGDHFWGHLVLPLNYQAGNRYPLVITTYRDGDSFLRGGAGDEYPIQVFAANGFAVLNFDIGQPRTSKSDDFETAILFWDSPVEGLQAAIAKVVDMGIVDRSRIGITGLSHGAMIVDYAISHTSAFRAAIASSPGWDPIMYEFASDSERANLAGDFHLGSPDGEARGRWQRVSAALNATRITTPLLINAADTEYLSAMQLVTVLRDLKKPVEMFIYDNELHVKNDPRHRYEIYQRNVDWMKFWLNGEESADSAKVEQYRRWRELRSEQDQKQVNAPKR